VTVDDLTFMYERTIRSKNYITCKDQLKKEFKFLAIYYEA